MRPSSILIVSIDRYFSEILTFFTGLFNYCTCGHCGWEIIVCPSVRSFQSFISSLFFSFKEIPIVRLVWIILVSYWHVGSLWF